MRFSYLSVDAGEYTKAYIEQHVTNDPHGAEQKLQAAQGGAAQFFGDDRGRHLRG